jgi:nucleoside-diphosphate-sugar epimerase/1-acyl-sn-glycerol-3-phosphate acyltransferase
MSILLTGSTGFLGNGLLYLISNSDNIDKYRETVFYLIIRSKKSESAHTRLEQMRSLFPTLRLELFYEDMSKIQDFETDKPIETIINCAAAIDFNLPIQEALEQNVSNMRNLIAFAKKNKVKNFIHISTAYVNDPYNNDIKNEFINLKLITDDRNIDQVYEDIKESKLSFKEIQKVQYFPNTYTFTKCLAELFIKKEIFSDDGTNVDRIDFKIIRPSIITVSNLVPYPGWFKGFAAIIGVTSLTQLSLQQYLYFDNNSSNPVSVDYVCQIILNAVEKTSDAQIIYNATSPYGSYDINLLKYSSNIYFKSNPSPVKKYILKHFVLSKLYLYWIYIKTISYCFKPYVKLAVRTRTLYNAICRLDSDFSYFWLHTYNFNTKILCKPKYESTSDIVEYGKLVIDSIRIKLNIVNNPTKTFVLKQIWTVFKKCGFTFYNFYKTFLVIIFRIIFKKICKSLDIQFDSINLYSKINNSIKPLVIISNHQSILDTFILQYIFTTHPKLCIDTPHVIVSEDAVASINTRFLSFFLGASKIVTISKNNFESNIFEHIIRNKLYDKNIIIYCEGEVSRDKVIHKFNSDAYNIMKQNMDFNVLPISITYDRVPEREIFYKSIIDGLYSNVEVYNNSRNIFYYYYYSKTIIMKLMEILSQKNKISCVVYLGNVLTSDTPIESIRSTIILNHAKSYNYNPHYSNFNCHNMTTTSTLSTHYYLDNLNAVLYNYSIQTPLVKSLRSYYDLSCIGDIHSYNIHKITSNNKIDIDKFQSCLIFDFNVLKHKKTDNLLLGVYSQKIFENISSDVIEEILNHQQ